MDPKTAIWVALLMMLLNGGVLGFMHRDLPADLRPSAVSWLIGTLLQACGSMLLALQGYLPAGIVLPLANAMLMLGLTGYWRALRQFYGLPERYYPMWLPTLLGTAGIYWYAAIEIDFALRVVSATLAWLVILWGCIYTLHSQAARNTASSRHVLSTVFAVLAVFMLLRMFYYLSIGHVPADLLQKGDVINLLTPMVATIAPVIGTTAFLLLCSEQITRRWVKAAATDYLTGLANRRTVVALGETQVQSAVSSHLRPALFVIDIDHFKQINDRHGHATGDRGIQMVASCLERHCAGACTGGRLGGEEFVALYPDLNPDQALQVAHDLCLSIAGTPVKIDISEATITLTVSIGVATFKPGDRHFDDLLQRADQAMYAAKAASRNRVEMAT